MLRGWDSPEGDVTKLAPTAGLSKTKEDKTSVHSAEFEESCGDRRRMELSVPAPEKFNLHDDYDIWEAQVRRFVKHFKQCDRTDVVLNLVGKDAYSRIVDTDHPEDVDDLFRFLRRRIGQGVSTDAYKREFFAREQRDEETLRDCIMDLRRLARNAFPESKRNRQEFRVLERLLVGVAP